jgi:hypothetical protein
MNILPMATSRKQSGQWPLLKSKVATKEVVQRMIVTKASGHFEAFPPFGSTKGDFEPKKRSEENCKFPVEYACPCPAWLARSCAVPLVMEELRLSQGRVTS